VVVVVGMLPSMMLAGVDGKKGEKKPSKMLSTW
jgi:hypothetical protein